MTFHKHFRGLAFTCAIALMVSGSLTGCSAGGSASSAGSSSSSGSSSTSGSASAGNTSGSSASAASGLADYDPDKSVSESNFYFDTIITLTIYGTEDDTLIQDCFSLASHYENLLSNTIETSEISQINAYAGTGQAVTVSDDTLDVINRGLYYCDLSGGAFDITCGTLSSLWNFAEIAENLDTENNSVDASLVPSDQEVADALATVDYQQLEVNGNDVLLKNAGTKLDLGGIAKGYIADKMKEYLVSEGVTSAMINLGGNVLLIGSKVDGSNYKIGIQKPFDAQNAVLAVVQTSDKSVVTSGVYERYYTVNGKLYHHLLDLTTGYPCDNGLYSVTIISDSSTDGDALSTTCFALGEEMGKELIESLDGIEAIFVDSDLNVTYTSGIGSDQYPFELR